jgi:hypothetical protein
VTTVESTVSLFGNNQLICETKAATNGTWSIVTTILDDGIYDISQKVTNTGGAFTQQILPKKLMIDGTAANLQITGQIEAPPTPIFLTKKPIGTTSIAGDWVEGDRSASHISTI